MSLNSAQANNASQQTTTDGELDEIVHIFYPSQSSVLELIPLVITYLSVFIYVYFSMKKVDMFSSKLGMAFSALATVVASLCMSVGLCYHFGMVIQINGKMIYPYLVIIIGLENILVLTRSVVSTAVHLDVKIRVAQGLSKEGWNITKTLLAEITILTIGFFTFVPMIQEFCILAIVGLISDFILQTFLFAPILSVDIHRAKLPSHHNHSTTYDQHNYPYPPFQTPMHPSSTPMRPYNPSGYLPRVKSNPKMGDMNGCLKKSGSSVSVVAPSRSAPILVKIPKRLRLVYFWARTRFFQRAFTIFMVGWISVIVYESGIVARFDSSDTERMANILANQHSNKSVPFDSITQNLSGTLNNSQLPWSSSNMSGTSQVTLQDLFRKNPYAWRKLPADHWQVLLGVYNFSLSGKYVSVLPPLCISIPVTDKRALELRHPSEILLEKNQPHHGSAWFLGRLDRDDAIDEFETGVPTMPSASKGDGAGFFTTHSEDPYVPHSPIELALTILLAIPSIIFMAYMFVVFYRCVCSRNYAEWRSSWTKRNWTNGQDSQTQVL